MPSKLRPWYKYAMDFVAVVRSKTPRIVYANDFLKCYLMDNPPLANIEIEYKDRALLLFSKRPTNSVRCLAKVGSSDMELVFEDRIVKNRRESLLIDAHLNFNDLEKDQ